MEDKIGRALALIVLGLVGLGLLGLLIPVILFLVGFFGVYLVFAALAWIINRILS